MSDAPERVKLSKEEKDRRFQAELMPVLDPLYNFAYRLTLDEDDANDLVQETYLKAYRFFEYFEPGTNAKAWLFRILKNSFINDFRKKSKQPAKVIILCDLEGFTYEEMAKVLDIPIGTVRSRLHRARNFLKEKLEKYAAAMGYGNDDVDSAVNAAEADEA